MMTRDQLLALLVDQLENRDLEDSHWQADTALLAYINDPEISAAYDALDKWYA